MASTFAFDSFYGGASTSSKGCDSALSDTEWPTLNSVTTRRKAGRPPVSRNKDKKGGKKGRSSCEATGSNIKGKSVDNGNVSFNTTVNMSQDSVNTTTEILSSSVLAQVNEDNLQCLNESNYGDLLNKEGNNDSALSVGNVLSDSLLKEHIGVEDSLSNSGLMEALNANNPMSVDDFNTSQKTVELNVSVIEPHEPHGSENYVNQTP